MSGTIETADKELANFNQEGFTVMRFFISNGKSFVRFSNSELVQAWYIQGRVYCLGYDKLGGAMNVTSLSVKYLEVFVDGSYCMASSAIAFLDRYDFSEAYKRYALELSKAFFGSATGGFDGNGDELHADSISVDKNYLFVSPDGFHHARIGRVSYLATVIDNFVYLYSFDRDGTLSSERKSLALFYVIQDKQGRIYEAEEYDELFASIQRDDDEFRWCCELIVNYFGIQGMEDVAVLNPSEVCSDYPTLSVKDGKLYFRQGVHDYLKEACVVGNAIRDGYGRTPLDKPFNFVVTPGVSFTEWYRTLSRVLLGSYNPEHLWKLWDY
jgi:hypothetical protein